MNKKLVAVAIAGLLAAPLAQAQTANVTLYGRANMNMVFVNGGKLARRRQLRTRPSSGSTRTRRASAFVAPSRSVAASMRFSRSRTVRST